MITIFLGAPGTGKGTASSILKDEYGYKHISTGDMFRYHMKEQTPLGVEVQERMNRGDLIDDETTWNMLEEYLKGYDLNNDKIILDGYPRTINQADILMKFVEENNVELSTTINFELDRETIVKRLSGRRMCPDCGAIYNVYFSQPKVEGKCDVEGSDLIQREDDGEENIKNRLNEYNELTFPLIEYFTSRDLLTNVDANKEMNSIAKEIDGILN